MGGRRSREVGRILRRMGTKRPRDKGKTFAQEFGERLRAARDRRGLTQKQLAEEAEMHPPRISNYENGDVLPELEGAAKLAAVLDVSLDELVLGRPREAPDEPRDARLRASVRELEEMANRPAIDSAVMMLDGLVALTRHDEFESRRGKRRAGGRGGRAARS